MAEFAVLGVVLLFVVTSSAEPDLGPWRVGSSDTSVELAVSNGAPLVRRLNGVGSGHNWANGEPRIALPDHVWVDGRQEAAAWRFEGCATDDTQGTVSLEFSNESPRLDLRSIWRGRPGPGPVEHWIEIENRSETVVTLPHHDSLSLQGLSPDGPAEAWWINRGGGNASTQGGVFNALLDPETDLVLPTRPDDGASPVPWLAIQKGGERGLYFGWEFSGVGRIHVLGDDGGKVTVHVGNDPDFLADVAPGAVFLVPPAFVGCYEGDIEDGSYQLHRFILDKLRPKIPEGIADPTLMCAVYVDSTSPQANEAYVLANAQLCRDTGFETFMTDAWWFRQVGDWVWDPARFPKGMTPLSEFLKSHGIGAALWCAWTLGGASDDPGALSVRGPNGHPDWFPSDLPPDWQPGLFWGAPVCLACEDAEAWAIEKTKWLVSEYGLSYLKHDIGPIITACGREDHRHQHGVDVSYRSALGYYKVMDELRRSRPDVVLENCSGGGHIKDFGVIQRTHYTVTTDTLSNLPDRQSIYDSTFAFPPLILQAYTFDNMYGAKGDDPGPFLWRSAMMSAWQIAPVHGLDWSDEAKMSAERATEIYKRWIRPILQDAKVHHVLPRPDGLNWDGLFYWSPSLEKGTLYVFRPDSDEESKTVKLKGLVPNRRYLVWSEDGSISPGARNGYALMTQGLEIQLPNRYTSDLVYIQDGRGRMPADLAVPSLFLLKEAEAESDAFTSSATLSWEASSHARSYRVVVHPTGNPNHPIVDRVILGTSVTLPDLPHSMTLLWRVQALSWGGKRWNKGGAGQFATPRLVPLRGVRFSSGMEWVRATIGVDEPVRRDVNLYDNRIAIAGTQYPKGIWTHAFADGTPADIEINLAAQEFATFAADVGLDDSSGGGSVQFQVLVDGVVIAESPVLRPRVMHRFSVPVAGADRLTLRVLNGGDGYSCDHAAWGLARLIVEGETDPFAPGHVPSSGV